MKKLYLREDLANAWAGRDPFRTAATLPGEMYREKEGRRTLRFVHDGRGYFLKYHAGIGWGEILKSLSQAKAPVLGAAQEKRAIEALRSAGIDTMTIAGFGEQGLSPASRESFIVTDELADTLSLEDVCESWPDNPPVPAVRRHLVTRLADISRLMHQAGVNHRDYYLCHFLVDRDRAQRQDFSGPLYLIDLHRSQVRLRVPRRWRVKDLGGLYFSAARSGITRRDIVAFIRAYAGTSAGRALRKDPVFWRRVRAEAEKIYRRYYGKEPLFPLQFSEHPGFFI
jgi:heptose I phosphotransferase